MTTEAGCQTVSRYRSLLASSGEQEDLRMMCAPPSGLGGRGCQKGIDLPHSRV